MSSSKILTEESIYRNFIAERKKFRILKLILSFFGYLCLFSYLYIIFFTKNHEVRFIFLGVLSVYARLSGFVLNKYFEVPEIFQNLFSTNENISDIHYRIIDSRRKEILSPLLKNIYGMIYPKELMSADKNKIMDILKQIEHYDWRKIGNLYLLKFVIVVSLMIWIIFEW